MEKWEADLTQYIAEVHAIDSEAFTAMENMHKARCSVMEAAMQRQQGELSVFRNEFQEQLAEVAKGTLQLPQEGNENYFRSADLRKAVKRRQHYAPPNTMTPKALDKLMRRRIEVAKAESAAASDAHARAAVVQLANFAMKEQEHLLNFQMAVEKVGPELATSLEDELSKLTQAAQAAARAAREAQTASEAAAHQSENRSQVKKSSSLRKEDSNGATGKAASKLPHPAHLRGQVHPAGVHARTNDAKAKDPYDRLDSPQASYCSMDADQHASDGFIDEDGNHVQNGRASTEMLAESPASSHASRESGLGDREEEFNRRYRRLEIDRQKQELDATKAAVEDGDWVNARKDILEVAEAGAEALKASESALEAQAKALREAKDHKGITTATNRLMKHAEDYAMTIRSDFVRVRNMKVALCRARAQYARDAQQQHNFEVLEFEDDVLPAISKLAHEAETAVEVGHALKRGVDKIPICVIAGAWRRAIVASFPVLKHLWDGARVEKPEREQFVSRLFDALLRAPGAVEMFETQTANGQVPPGLRTSGG
jgi:hypothetical protein